MRRWLKKTISMLVRFISSLIQQRLEKDIQAPSGINSPKKKMIEEVIERLYEVPGITNDQMRLYTDKASIYVTFRDGSGTLRRFINFAQVQHIYVFDKKGICHFSGYVGWIHNKALENKLHLININFGKN